MRFSVRCDNCAMQVDQGEGITSLCDACLGCCKNLWKPEWQPISLAPMGSDVLIYRDETISVGYFERDEWDVLWVQLGQYHWKCKSDPIFWQPLPEPPEEV